MVASACANLEWLDAAVTPVPLATMALALQAVKVFVCLCICPLFSFHPHYENPSSLWLCFFLRQLCLGFLGTLQVGVLCTFLSSPNLPTPTASCQLSLYLVPSLPV